MIIINALSFNIVIQVLNFSDSRVPQQFMPQRIAMNTTAKKQESSTPKIVAEYNHFGKIIPTLAKRPTKYADMARTSAAATAP
jgi:hypothetical protein